MVKCELLHQINDFLEVTATFVFPMEKLFIFLKSTETYLSKLNFKLFKKFIVDFYFQSQMAMTYVSQLLSIVCWFPV